MTHVSMFDSLRFLIVGAAVTAVIGGSGLVMAQAVPPATIPRNNPTVPPAITDPAPREPGVIPRPPAVTDPVPPPVEPASGEVAPGPMIPAERSTPVTSTIPDLIAAGGQFKILGSLLKKSGLDRSLAGEGPFTLIAPYDKAFSDLPPETLAALEKPENVDKLIAILKMHVILGKLSAKELAPLDRSETISGRDIAIARQGKEMSLGGANVLEANVQATNGVIHVVDKVILP